MPRYLHIPHTPTPEPTTNPWGEAMTREFEVEDEWD